MMQRKPEDKKITIQPDQKITHNGGPEEYKSQLSLLVTRWVRIHFMNKGIIVWSSVNNKETVIQRVL